MQQAPLFVVVLMVNETRMFNNILSVDNHSLHLHSSNTLHTSHLRPDSFRLPFLISRFETGIDATLLELLLDSCPSNERSWSDAWL